MKRNFVLLLISAIIVACNGTPRIQPPTESEFIDASVQAVGLVKSIVDDGMQFNLTEQVGILSERTGLMRQPEMDSGALKSYGCVIGEDVKACLQVGDSLGIVYLGFVIGSDNSENVLYLKEFRQRFVQALNDRGMYNLDPEYQDTQLYMYGGLAGRAAIGSDVSSKSYSAKNGQGYYIKFYGERK